MMFKMLNSQRIAMTQQEIAAKAKFSAGMQAENAVQAVNRQRLKDLRNDPAVMAARFNMATAQRIDEHFANNVNSPAQVIAELKTIYKLMAAMPRR